MIFIDIIDNFRINKISYRITNFRIKTEKMAVLLLQMQPFMRSENY